MRDSNPNKLLLSELFAYVAKPTKHAKTTFLTAIVLICVDSGASSTCTMNRNDFLPETLLSHQWTCHQWCVSLSSSLEVFGVRTVRWVIHNDDLEPIDVEIERSLLLIRDIPMCLLCPQDLAQQTGGLRDGFSMGSSDTATLTNIGNNNLSIFSSFPQFTSYSASLVGNGSLRDTPNLHTPNDNF